VGWQTTSDVAEFLAAAGPFLRADRVRNTVLLTVTETIRENPAIHRAGPAADPAADPDGLPLFGWWTVEAAVGGAFLHTPPFPDGAPRRADDGDVPLLTDWFGAFAREVNDFARDTDHTAAVRERLSYRGFTVWEADGKPVSLAGVTRQVAGMTRVGPVYTPPESRGHGYASAATAAASERARAAGAEEVLLFTDLDNPVSNSIYQRIGYRPVEDRVVLSFSERSRPPAEGQAP
jgi:RimJ/RimL family protein N-acetyltransferase